MLKVKMMFTQGKKKYLPSHKRVPNPPSMRLTERDRDIIRGVYRYRLLASPQVEALFFPFARNKPHSKRTVCQRRLQLLYHHCYLERIQVPVILGEGRKPSVYALAKRGADLIASEGGQDRGDVGWKPNYKQYGQSFIDHSLAVNNLQVGIELLCAHSDLTLKGWVSEADFRTAIFKDRVPYRMRGARTIRIFPDGYFSILVPSTNKPLHFFIEVDQGTMTNSRWQEKMLAYNQFRTSGLSQKYYQARNFRVLSIISSQARLNNLKKASEKVGADHHFWFTSQENIDIWQPQKLLAPIWDVATKTGQDGLFSKPVLYHRHA